MSDYLEEGWEEKIRRREWDILPVNIINFFFAIIVHAGAVVMRPAVYKTVPHTENVTLGQ